MIAERVVSNADAMLGYWDRYLRCRFANRAYCQWTGSTTAELLGVRKRELFGDHFDFYLPRVCAALQGEIQVFEESSAGTDGVERHFVTSYFPDIVHDQVHGFCVQRTDVTEMKRVEKQLEAARAAAEQIVTHDVLTGLPNRRHLMERIDAAAAEAQALGRIAGVVAIDLDNFKMVNARYGHDIGDLFIQEIACRLQMTTREKDTVTRFGGDEFIYVATNLRASENLQSTISRIRLTVCQPFVECGVVILPRFSCGVAVYPWHGQTGLGLMARADHALYRAKAKGGGAVTYADALIV